MINSKYWRLIPFLETNGALQMQIDRFCLQQHRLGFQPPILRFYSWSPAAISLGYHQRDYPLKWHNITWQGKPLNLVRRPTGGRAVLHQGDLTYMVVASNIPGNRERVYKTICQFLIEGMRSLGIELNYGRAGRGYIGNPNCFALATAADLIDSEGRKSIGSAQLRQGKAFLQHGSISLSTDRTLFARVFDSPLKAAKIPENLEPQAIIESLQAAASNCFNIELVERSFSEREWQQILSQPSGKMR